MFGWCPDVGMALVFLITVLAGGSGSKHQSVSGGVQLAERSGRRETEISNTVTTTLHDGSTKEKCS